MSEESSAKRKHTVPMFIFTDPENLRKWVAKRRMAGKKIALVPTMGYLHDGHMSLIRAAKAQGADEVIVSIFVNPIQFGPKEDFASYPRNSAADFEKCKKAGVVAVFAPSVESMYSADFSTRVHEDRVSKDYCGARRPGHFNGVCTVIAKLFNVVNPALAVFGQKDYQQVTVIKRMVRDLDYGVKIVTAPIVREPSGLALSSRNTYLSADERERALALSRELFALRDEIRQSGPKLWSKVKPGIVRRLKKAGLRVDYVKAADRESLKPLAKVELGRTVVLGAIYCGRTRLIDNVLI